LQYILIRYETIPDTNNIVLKLYSTQRSPLGIGPSRCIAKHSQCLIIPYSTLLLLTKEDNNSVIGMHQVTFYFEKNTVKDIKIKLMEFLYT
jgi:hypothetical protein